LDANRLVATGLAGKIAFKISCRSDEVRRETMACLVGGGLTDVYMGVESGDEQGLANMNKMLKPHHQILRDLRLSFDFGFMLLEPYSMLQNVRNTIASLDRFVGDGWTVSSFCRTLPYAGTPLKRLLEAEGRLLGTPFEPDYMFLDRNWTSIRLA
jgi:anaerobic magnesium-protoporphyrin IX monomethyl ester cyclase